MQVVTNEEGPFGPDVFWLLEGHEVNGKPTGCFIPMGATGEKNLLKRLFELPGFDSAAFTEAMGSTSNQTFSVWEQPGKADGLARLDEGV